MADSMVMRIICNPGGTPTLVMSVDGVTHRRKPNRTERYFWQEILRLRKLLLDLTKHSDASRRRLIATCITNDVEVLKELNHLENLILSARSELLK